MKNKSEVLFICGNPYAVTVESKVGGDGLRMGETCFSERWIKIHSGLIRDHVIASLAHEIGHEVINEGGVLSALSDSQQEIACNIAGKVAETMFKNIPLIEKLVKASARMGI